MFGREGLFEREGLKVGERSIVDNMLAALFLNIHGDCASTAVELRLAAKTTL